MNFKKVCQFGAKVLIAGVAVVAVYFGIDKLLSKTGSNTKEVNSSSSSGNSVVDSDLSQQNSSPKEINEGSNNVISGLKKTQDICGKLFAVFQSLIMVVESVNRVFKNDGNQLEFGQYSQYNPWCYSQYPVVQMDNGNVWTRLSPYIVAAGPNPNSRNCNNYGNNYSI